MRFRLPILLLFIPAVFPTLSHARCIGFEDLTRYHPWGYVADMGGKIEDNYQELNWSAYRTGNPDAENPSWGTREGIVAVGGVGDIYAYNNELPMTNGPDGFDIQSLNAGSYGYRGQDVYAAVWENNIPKYSGSWTIDPVFEIMQLPLIFSGIHRFALRAGNAFTCTSPTNGDFPILQDLCVDSIVCDTYEPAPVSEPSTLLILGTGILGLTKIYRKYITIE